MKAQIFLVLLSIFLVTFSMKKTNNKYRNNNNSFYSLNYKFDSNSIAGKISGTALDLIRRYNDMAKDAHSNNDYVTAEIFRQYAEHYRKIVTEINERKAPREQVENNANDNNSNNSVSVESIPATETVAETATTSAPDAKTSTNESAQNTAEAGAEQVVEKRKPAKRSFHVIEIAPQEPAVPSENQPKRRRTIKNKSVAEG